VKIRPDRKIRRVPTLGEEERCREGAPGYSGPSW